MLGCEMKHKHTFALHSFLPATFGREKEQATAGSSFLNWQSWIHQKFSAWVLILEPVVMVSTWEGTIPSHITSRVKENRYLPLALLSEVFCCLTVSSSGFSPALPVDHWKFSKKAVCWNRSESMVCLRFSEAVWLVFCFLPSSWSIQTPWAQQQTALNELEIFSDNIFVIKCLAVLIFRSPTAWFIASVSLPVETSTPVDG